MYNNWQYSTGLYALFRYGNTTTYEKNQQKDTEIVYIELNFEKRKSSVEPQDWQKPSNNKLQDRNGE